MPKDETNPEMWTYWRDKCGIVEAIKQYYPSRLSDPAVLTAITMIKMAEGYLDSLMSLSDD